MGRPPCCDKIGVKKGPWTPEEDIVLVSYIQQHGPGNWKAVPANTGLLRCSKSCRLRWTNYLRPGIKRGSFTEHEEKMIIHLQALLGNRWAAIASYLPLRTDNDIKNYWNTHLRKKLAKLRGNGGDDHDGKSSSSHSITKGQWEMRLQTDIQLAKQALYEALSGHESDDSSLLLPRTESQESVSFSKPSSETETVAYTYASSLENIAHLLGDWMKRSPKSSQAGSSTESTSFNNPNSSSSPSEATFFSLNSDDEAVNEPSPLSFIEKWLLDEAGSQGQEEDFTDMNMEETCHDLF